MSNLGVYKVLKTHLVDELYGHCVRLLGETGLLVFF